MSQATVSSSCPSASLPNLPSVPYGRATSTASRIHTRSLTQRSTDSTKVCKEDARTAAYYGVHDRMNLDSPCTTTSEGVLLKAARPHRTKQYPNSLRRLVPGQTPEQAREPRRASKAEMRRRTRREMAILAMRPPTGAQLHTGLTLTAADTVTVSTP